MGEKAVTSIAKESEPVVCTDTIRDMDSFIHDKDLVPTQKKLGSLAVALISLLALVSFVVGFAWLYQFLLMALRQLALLLQ